VALPEETRIKLTEASVRAIEAIGYTNVGTMEYLLDADGQFYFMEMNTRLQVEHPVTELVTGIDLVREQIRIAAGEPLSFTDERPARGHAIELRVNAEDPNTFAPWPGKITALHMPGGLGVRVDTHVYAGYVVPPDYDSLLAKVIVHDVDRMAALRRAKRCLDEMVIEGFAPTSRSCGGSSTTRTSSAESSILASSHACSPTERQRPDEFHAR